MPLFQYTAINPKGKKIHGVVDADSLEAAKKRLVESKMVVTKLITGTKKKAEQLNTTTLLQFTRDVAGLLKSGLPLYESLVTISEKFQSHKNHEIFLFLADQVKQGNPLSKAMQTFPKSFDSIYIAMVESGEKTGSLDHVFMQLTKVISRDSTLRKQMHGAMVYPTFLGCFCLAILAGLFLFLIPSMKELFDGRRLHPITQKVLATSDWLNANALSLGVFLLSLITLLIFIARLPSTKRAFQKILLNLPLTKKIVTQSVLMRFARAFSVLLSSGVPTLEALRLSKKVMRHHIFEKLISKAELQLSQGESISSVFKKSNEIPPLMTRMLATAEEAGNMSDMLANIADIYEDEVERSLMQFTHFLQPVMLLVIGAIVGLVLLSVLLPLTDVSSFT